jgi:alkaline phosphatase D
MSSSQLAQAEILYSGVAAGDATNTSAILWTRAVDETTQQGIVSNLTAQVSTDPLLARSRTTSMV